MFPGPIWGARSVAGLAGGSPRAPLRSGARAAGAACFDSEGLCLFTRRSGASLSLRSNGTAAAFGASQRAPRPARAWLLLSGARCKTRRVQLGIEVLFFSSPPSSENLGSFCPSWFFVSACLFLQGGGANPPLPQAENFTRLAKSRRPMELLFGV